MSKTQLSGKKESLPISEGSVECISHLYSPSLVEILLEVDKHLVLCLALRSKWTFSIQSKLDLFSALLSLKHYIPPNSNEPPNDHVGLFGTTGTAFLAYSIASAESI